MSDVLAIPVTVMLSDHMRAHAVAHGWDMALAPVACGNLPTDDMRRNAPGYLLLSCDQIAGHEADGLSCSFAEIVDERNPLGLDIYHRPDVQHGPQTCEPRLTATCARCQVSLHLCLPEITEIPAILAHTWRCGDCEATA